MRYQNLLEGRDAPLYHGVRFDYAIEQLQKNRIEGRTSQRFWPDGRRLKDNHPEYEDSFWLKGVSLTRDIKYAQHMGDIVYVIDQRRLSQRYKIIPFNWGYSGKHRQVDPKREREEFVVLGKIYKSFKQYIEDYNNQREELWDQVDAAKENGDTETATHIHKIIQNMPSATDSWSGPIGSNIEPLDQYLLGIYADEIHKTMNNKKLNIITDHPLFKGFF